MQKDFDGWNNLKKKIDDKNSTELKKIFCREREIWFCSIGLNVGSEQNGRNESFERPVLIFKKVSAETFLVLPLTSNIVPCGRYHRVIPLYSLRSYKSVAVATRY